MCVHLACGTTMHGADTPVPALAASGILPSLAHDRAMLQAGVLRSSHLEYRETTDFTERPDMRTDMVCHEDFNAPRFYQRRQREIVYGKREHRDNEASFDGVYFYTGMGVQKLEYQYMKARIDDLTDPIHSMPLIRFGYCELAGYPAPRSMAELRSAQPIEPLVIRYLNKARAVQVTNVGSNVLCTMTVPDDELATIHTLDLKKMQQELQQQNRSIAEDHLPRPLAPVAEIIKELKAEQDIPAQKKVTLLLDAMHDYGILERNEETLTGRPVARIRVERWGRYGSNSIWMPSRIVGSFYRDGFHGTLKRTPAYSVVCEVTRLESPGRENVQFALDERREYKTTGTFVRERYSEAARTSKNHQVFYTVAGDGSLLRGLANSARRELSMERKYVWILAAAIVGLPLVYLMYRKRRSQ